MHIRPFAPQDRAAVIALWERCGLTRPWNDPDRDIHRKLLVQPELFLVGVLDGDLVGSAMGGYDGHRGSVYYLAVSPDCQGRGLGQMLMRALEEKLEALGCPKLNVLVRSGNLPVKGFYDGIGYAEDEVACLGKRLIPDD